MRQGRKKDTGPSGNKLMYEERKELDRKIRKIKNSIKKSEDKISELEEKIEGLVEILANPDAIVGDEDPFGEYGRLKEELEAEMEKWEKANEELDALQF